MKEVSREQFLRSSFLKLTLVSTERRMLRSSLFVIEVVFDRNSFQAKEKFSKLKLLSEQIERKLCLKGIALSKPLRAESQRKSVELLFKKLTDECAILQESIKLKNADNSSKMLSDLKLYIYNGLCACMDNSDDEQQLQDESETKEKPSQLLIPPQNCRMTWAEDQVQKSLSKLLKNRSSLLGFRSREEAESPMKEILKSIRSIWIKEGGRWAKKYYRLQENLLIITEREGVNRIIVLDGIKVWLSEGDETKIMVGHELANAHLEIRMSDIDDENQEYGQMYLALYTRLKGISLERSLPKEKNVIKIFLENIKNSELFQFKKPKDFVVKFTHETLTFSFPMMLNTVVQVELPVYSHYGVIVLEATETREVLVLQSLREHTEMITLPVQSIYDLLYNDKPKRKGPEVSFHEFSTKNGAYLMKMRYQEASTPRSYCTYGESERWEGEEQPVAFTRDQFRIQKNRLFRILWRVEQGLTAVGSLQTFEYPLRSALFYAGLLLCILFLDANNLPLYCLGVLICVLLYSNATVHCYLRDLVGYLDWESGLSRFVSLWDKQRFYEPEYQVRFKKDVEKAAFLASFQMKTKKKRNIYKKYKRLQEVLLHGQLYCTQFVSLCEKVKNLFTWYHHRKTTYLLRLFCLAFAALLLVPLRLFLLYGFYKMLRKGLRQIEVTKEMNKHILISILKLVVEEENLEEMRQYCASIHMNINKQLPVYTVFERKSKEYLEDILQIDYDHAGIFGHGRSMAQFIELLASCKKRFVITKLACQKHNLHEEWSDNRGTVAKLGLILYGFLLNIPSDRSILSTDSPENTRDQDSEEEDDEEF